MVTLRARQSPASCAPGATMRMGAACAFSDGALVLSAWAALGVSREPSPADIGSNQTRVLPPGTVPALSTQSRNVPGFCKVGMSL